jgi:hypothetical protein
MEDLENPFNGLSEAAGAAGLASERLSAALVEFQEGAAATFDEIQRRLIEGFFGSPE